MSTSLGEPTRATRGRDQPAGRLGAATAILACIAAAFTIAWPSLTWPMTFDDLVLIRAYTTQELIGVFHGQWDPEKIMVRGFRPGTTVFNHVRYTLFGENVVGHRTLVVLLYGLYAGLLAVLATRFGLDRLWGIVGAIGGMFVVYSNFHYVWLTDGNHLIQGLSFAGSLWFSSNGLSAGRWIPLLGSLLALSVGLLTREDTLACVPALLILGYAMVRLDPARRRLWFAHVAMILALCVGLMVYRRIVVPRAQPPGTDVPALIEAIWMMLNPLGVVAFDWWSGLAIGLWRVGLLVLLVLLIRSRKSIQWYWPVAWGLCAVLACSSALNLLRDDLFLFPASFAALAFCALVSQLVSLGGFARVASLFVLATGLCGGFVMSRIYAENFHPDSLRTIWWNGRYVYGKYSAKANIPEARREAMIARLAAAGIHDDGQHERRTPRFVRQAIAAGRRRPGDPGVLFYPWLAWSED